jgi:hypothetical protein
MGSIQKNADLFNATYAEVEISADGRAFFQGIEKRLYVLAIAADWGPAVDNTLHSARARRRTLAPRS